MSSNNKNKDKLNLPYFKEIQNFSLMDSEFFKAVADDNLELGDTIANIFLPYIGLNNFKTKSAKTEYSENSPKRHGVVLDLLLEGETGDRVNVEVQKNKEEGFPFRIRAYLANDDVYNLLKGHEYDELGNTIIIILSEIDLLDSGQGVLYGCTMDPRTGFHINDGRHIFIANLEVDDPESEKLFPGYKELLKDFTQRDYRKIKNPVIRKSHKKYKTEEKELKTMNEAVQRLIDKAVCEKDATIEEVKAQNREKDATIRQRDVTIRERDATIKEVKAQNREKDATIREKDATILKLQKELKEARNKNTSESVSITD